MRTAYFRLLGVALALLLCICSGSAKSDTLSDFKLEPYLLLPAPDNPDTEVDESLFNTLANAAIAPDGSIITSMFGNFTGKGHRGIGQIKYNPVTKTNTFSVHIDLGFDYGVLEKLVIVPNSTRALVNYIGVAISGAAPDIGTLEIDTRTWTYKKFTTDPDAIFLAGIAVDPEGAIYRADASNSTIFRTEPDGTKTTKWIVDTLLAPGTLVPGQGVNGLAWNVNRQGLEIGNFGTGAKLFARRNPVTREAEPLVVDYVDSGDIERGYLGHLGIDELEVSRDGRYVFTATYTTNLMIRYDVSKSPVVAEILSIPPVPESVQLLPTTGCVDPHTNEGFFVTSVGLNAGEGALYLAKR